jgi:hypothetical protein
MVQAGRETIVGSGLCAHAQQSLYINYASPKKRPQEGPSKARPTRKPLLQCCEVNVIVNEPNEKSCDNSKQHSQEKRHLMFVLPR